MTSRPWLRARQNPDAQGAVVGLWMKAFIVSSVLRDS